MTRRFESHRHSCTANFVVREGKRLDRLLGRIRSALQALLGTTAGDDLSVRGLDGNPAFIPAAAREEVIRSEICRARGDARQSAWHLRMAIEIHPHYPEAHYRLGIYWLELGHRDLANSYFRRAAELSFGDRLLNVENASAGNGILKAGKVST